MLVRCLYASHISRPQSAQILRSILEDSRKNNIRNGITGVLVSTGDCFIQALEGGRQEVSETYNNIVQDKRHSHVTMLSFEEITQRSFESWSMGEVTFGHVNPAILLKHSPSTKIDPFSMLAVSLLALLHELVAAGTVISGNSNRGRKT